MSGMKFNPEKRINFCQNFSYRVSHTQKVIAKRKTLAASEFDVHDKMNYNLHASRRYLYFQLLKCMTVKYRIGIFLSGTKFFNIFNCIYKVRYAAKRGRFYATYFKTHCLNCIPQFHILFHQIYVAKHR